MENITPEPISVEVVSQEEDNKEPVFDTQKEEKDYCQGKRQCCSRRGHWRHHNHNNTNEKEGEEGGFDMPPPFWRRHNHGRFARHPCRKTERKCCSEEDHSGNNEEKEALNKQIRETKKQLKTLIIQKIQKRFPDCPPRKSHQIAKRIMFHQSRQLGGISPQCRLQCGIPPPPPPGPQFWGAPRQCGIPPPPQQSQCERLRRGHHERRHVHCHRRRECERPPCAPFEKPCERSPCELWLRQFGVSCERSLCHRQYSGHFRRPPCERPQPSYSPWRRQFPGHFSGQCERQPFGSPQFGPFVGRGEKPTCHGTPCNKGQHHEMKRLRRWRMRMARCGFPSSPPCGQWGRPEFGLHGTEMRYWRR
ncbi:hypothetical protein TRFO_07333 [Tritrichomonas foetus]|uniref:Uncharacterized protein n=1 Tax=Tritrichomonas foetus TaxID=1144522 RepID=A0A1J4JW90_9EUKA|nr:hypothetical protein TRFO_07333 [Tritrichomonas foetus]|eukprot:OHT01790.1 hypothetical protein TRFO_07333 [Tritrichomonas foetus]